MFVLKAFVALSVVAIASASPGGDACEEQFNRGSFAAATGDGDLCSAIAAYSKCLGALSELDSIEHEPRLVQYELASDCKEYKSVPPVIKSTDSSLHFTVDNKMEATFFRHRREEVNVFSMSARVNQLVEDFKADGTARDKAAKDAKAAQDTLDAKLTKEVADASKALNDKMAALSAKLTGESTALETSLTTKLSTTANTLNDAMKVLNKGVETSVDALKKSLTASVDTKISAIPKAVYMDHFVHWGQRGCPGKTKMWYSGIYYGPHHHHGGSGESECINNDGKDNGGRETGTSSLDLLYFGAIDHPHGTNLPRNQVVPCAVCMSDVPCILARGMKTCPKDYKIRYKGYMFGQHHSHRASNDRICINSDFKGGYGGYQSNWIYATRIQDARSNVKSGKSLECALCCYDP